MRISVHVLIKWFCVDGEVIFRLQRDTITGVLWQHVMF